MCVAKYQFKSVLSLTCILKKGVLLSESCILWRKTRKFRIYVNLLDELITPQEFIPEYIEVVIFCCEVLLGYFKSLDKLHKKLLIIQHFLFFFCLSASKTNTRLIATFDHAPFRTLGEPEGKHWYHSIS